MTLAQQLGERRFLNEPDRICEVARKVRLENCTTNPRPFRERFALLTQELVEKDAHQLYLGAKRILHRAALLGYDEIPNGSSSAAMLSALKG